MLALDPLSGSGTWNAIKGAEIAAKELCGFDGTYGTYNEWCELTFDQEWKTRVETYSKAYNRFEESFFWKRRI